MLVAAFCEQQSRETPRLQEIFANREADPRAYKIAKEQLADAFQSRFGRLAEDQAVTEDRWAVKAAMASAGAPAQKEPPEKYGNLSNKEFSALMKSKYGFDPSVGG